MSYCVNCGVELASNEKKCPLCNTPLYIPPVTDGQQPSEPLFPYNEVPISHNGRKSLIELLSLAFFLPIPLLIFCNMNISGEITWAGIPIGAIVLLYVLFVLPFIPKKGNIVLSIVFDFIALSAYLWYIEYLTKGSWFLFFVLPLIGLIALFSIILTIIKKNTKISNLSLVSIGFLFLGILCISIEFLLNICFSIRDYLLWSLYPFLALALLSFILLYINRNTSLKEKLKRKFLY